MRILIAYQGTNTKEPLHAALGRPHPLVIAISQFMQRQANNSFRLWHLMYVMCMSFPSVCLSNCSELIQPNPKNQAQRILTITTA
jgi:hypothetical protein